MLTYNFVHVQQHYAEQRTKLLTQSEHVREGGTKKIRSQNKKEGVKRITWGSRKGDSPRKGTVIGKDIGYCTVRIEKMARRCRRG